MNIIMNKHLLLTRSNIRAAKGQTAAIIVLILMASIMMNLWLMLSMDYKKNFDRHHDRLNEGHITLTVYPADGRSISTDFKKQVTDILEKPSEVTEFCMTDAFCASGTIPYNGGDASSIFVMLEKDSALSRNVGASEIVGKDSRKNGIYLPLIYAGADNYSIGDKVTLTLGGTKIKYTVCGFMNNAMSSSPNCVICSLLLTEEEFHTLAEKNAAAKTVLISARVKDKTKDEHVEATLKNEISKKFPGILIASNSYSLVTTSRYISQMICAGIMSTMAFFILLIAIVVISSNVSNYIHNNMPNLGALKAIGYTSRQLILAMITQFSGISIATAAVGTALSYLIFPPINKMMMAQTGIPYQVRFLPVPCLITIFFITMVTAAAVCLSAGKIQSINPILAIRQGIMTHNFKKNHIPLEQTSLPLHAALAMKTTFSGLKHNITVCVTMLVLSLILVFSGVMFENVIINMEPFINLVMGESADCSISINADGAEEVLSSIKKDRRVKKFYLYTDANLEHVGGASLDTYISDDFSKLNNQSMIIRGRFPKYDNEVAIAAKYAKENKLKVGDEISLQTEGHSQTYIISGFTQQSNNLGKDSLITREGYEKLSRLSKVAYHFNLTHNTDIDDFNHEMTKRFGNEIDRIVNIQSSLEGGSRVYIALMTIIVVAVLVLSGIIITFVMYLLVRTLLNTKKRDYGILKALGFTTRQLVFQTALSFMPSVILSTIAGIFISMQIINPLLTIFLSGIGIVKCTFTIPLEFNIIAGTGLILFAFAAACFLSLRIRRIAPRSLLAGE